MCAPRADWATRRLRVWQTIRTDAEIAADYRAAVNNRTGLNFYWQFDEASVSTVASDSSGNGRLGRVGHLSSVDNIMTYSTAKKAQAPEPPVRRPSTAPVVGDGPVVTVVTDGSNTITLNSLDPDDDDLTTTIVSEPAYGSLLDAAGYRLFAGSTVHDADRRQNKRVVYRPSLFTTNWTSDTFTFAVNDGGADSIATVVLERFRIPQPRNRSFLLQEDTVSYIILSKPYITSQIKRTANLRVRITELPARGTLYQACFEGTTYPTLCSELGDGADRISTPGTLLTNSRGIVMFRPAENTFDEDHYATFHYEYVDPDDESLSSLAATVQISVAPVNDVPVGIPLSNIHAAGPTVVGLAGTDHDDTLAQNGSARRHFARISRFPSIGTLFQKSGNSPGALLDATIPHMATVVVSRTPVKSWCSLAV